MAGTSGCQDPSQTRCHMALEVERASDAHTRSLACHNCRTVRPLGKYPPEGAATKRNRSSYTETETVTVSPVSAVFVAAEIDGPKPMLLEQPMETFTLDARSLRCPRHVAGKLRHQRNQVVVRKMVSG